MFQLFSRAFRRRLGNRKMSAPWTGRTSVNVCDTSPTCSECTTNAQTFAIHHSRLTKLERSASGESRTANCSRWLTTWAVAVRHCPFVPRALDSLNSSMFVFFASVADRPRNFEKSRNDRTAIIGAPRGVDARDGIRRDDREIAHAAPAHLAHGL